MLPFIVYSLPRSRTYWLSQFLDYGDYHCQHDPMANLRSIEDLRSAASMNYAGWVDTSAAAYWEVLRYYRPEARVLVVRRPVGEVMASFRAIDLRGVVDFDWAALERLMVYLDRRLDQISRLPGTLTVQYSQLDRPEVCKAIFEHCLGLPFDPEWYEKFASAHLEVKFRSQMRQAQAFAPQMRRFQSLVKGEMRRLVESGKIAPCRMKFTEDQDDGVTVQVGSVLEVLNDGQHLIEEHIAEIGPRGNVPLDMDYGLMAAAEAQGQLTVISARKNNALVGYLVFTISDSMENRGEKIAIQNTSFVDPAARGVGPRMFKFAFEHFKTTGLAEVFPRSGTRASGSKYPVLFKRLGAQEVVRVFSLRLKD